jgi:hypothetical protein
LELRLEAINSLDVRTNPFNFAVVLSANYLFD